MARVELLAEQWLKLSYSFATLITTPELLFSCSLLLHVSFDRFRLI